MRLIVSSYLLNSLLFTLLQVGTVFTAGVTGDEVVIEVYKGDYCSSRATESMKSWKVWAAFLRPNDMRRYSDKPNGVIIAVLEMLSGRDLMITMYQVDLWKNIGTFLQWRCYGLVETAVITTRSLAPRRIRGHMKRRCPWAMWTAPYAHVLHPVKLLFAWLKFVWWRPSFMCFQLCTTCGEYDAELHTLGSSLTDEFRYME